MMIPDATLTLAPPLLLAFAVLAAVRGAQLLAEAAPRLGERAAAFGLVRGIRALVVAIACACLAAALRFEARGLLCFALGFLAEEIYETGMVLLILRWDRRRAAGA